jgi:serine/threonine protein kinase
MSGAFGSPEMRCRLCGHQVPAARLGTRCPTDGSVLVLARDAEARPDDALLGRVIGGKFPVVGMLGEGGFGAVYRAVQEPVGRQVALKVIRGSDAVDPEIRARFFREAKVVAALSHPAVVTLHDYGEEPDGLLYIAFELVAGRPLTDLIRTEAPFAPARAVGLVCQVLAALTEAHGLGLLHRDLKPDNLMVVQGSLGEEKVRLLDFGLSKRFATDGKDSVATRQGIIMGTPRYMSPEQASGQSVDGRSDLYSMGILLYEMLSGRPPFVHTSPLDLLMAHIGEPVPPLPAGLNLPPALVQVVMRTLAKKADQRPQSAADLARELQAAVSEPGSPHVSSLSQPSMPAVSAGSGGLRPARPDEETAEHQIGAPPPVSPAPQAPPVAAASTFGTAAAPQETPRAVTVAAPASNRGKSPVPVILGGLGVGVGIGALVWFFTRSAPPPAPANLEPARQVVVVGANPSGGVTPTAPAPEPETDAPATAPPSPWERAIEFGKAGRHPEAGAQLIYLFRSSQDPWGVVERAKNDMRLETAMKLPQVQAAIGALPPKGAPSAAP